MANLHNRQGDVLQILREDLTLEKLKEQAEQVKPKAGQNILAEGEATGHAHRVAAQQDGAEVTMWMMNDTRFLHVPKTKAGTVKLTHEEHATVTLGEGVYEIRQQREWSGEAVRNVMD